MRHGRFGRLLVLFNDAFSLHRLRRSNDSVIMNDESGCGRK